MIVVVVVMVFDFLCIFVTLRRANLEVRRAVFFQHVITSREGCAGIDKQPIRVTDGPKSNCTLNGIR